MSGVGCWGCCDGDDGGDGGGDGGDDGWVGGREDGAREVGESEDGDGLGAG